MVGLPGPHGRATIDLRGQRSQSVERFNRPIDPRVVGRPVELTVRFMRPMLDQKGKCNNTYEQDWVNDSRTAVEVLC